MSTRDTRPTDGCPSPRAGGNATRGRAHGASDQWAQRMRRVDDHDPDRWRWRRPASRPWRPVSASRPTAATPSTPRWRRRSSRWRPSRAWSASPAAASSRCGRPTATRSSSTATSRCPVAGCPRTGSAAASARSSRRTAAGSTMHAGSRVGRDAGHRAGVRRWPTSATPGCPGRGWSRRPATAARHGYPMSHAAARYLVDHRRHACSRTDAEAHALVTRPDGSLLRRRRGGPQRRARRRPRRPRRPSGPALFVERRGRPRRWCRDGARRRAGHRRRPRGVPARWCAPAYTLDVGDWTIATNPPPAVGGPMLAVMLGELARRGDWTWSDALEIQHAVLTYRTSVHDFSARPRPGRPATCSPRSASTASPALRGSASTAHISADRRRGHGLRDHHEQRVRRGALHPRHRHPAQQLPRRGRAQPARPARRAARHPAGVQHGARRPAAPPTAGRWRSAPPAPTGSPPR